MIQTLALLLDAYRELNSKKLFWITLILSGLVMVLFGLLGASDRGLTFAGLHIAEVGREKAAFAYKMIFSYVAIGLWLTWAAVILAIISTAGIFPDLITGGTVDLYLSKPISRTRLFLTKYFTGLLFVAMQVAVFAIGGFLVLGIRADDWNPRLFLAIPLVVCMFSYLFAICVLFGVWTRSTIAAILLAVLSWFIFWGVQKTDEFFTAREITLRLEVKFVRSALAYADTMTQTPAGRAAAASTEIANARKAATDKLQELEDGLATAAKVHRITHLINALVPKTGETTNMLDRYLFSDADMQQLTGGNSRGEDSQNGSQRTDVQMAASETAADARAEIVSETRNTSPWYIIGTSLLSEAVIVTFACWIFCRRDY